MSKIKQIWNTIDFIAPHHFSSFNPRVFCSDDKPFNWGNFGCKRCDMIRYSEQKKKIILVK